MSFPSFQVLKESGTLIKGEKATLSLDQLKELYIAMCRTRHVDERMITLQRQGTISFALSSFGEEACSVAAAAGLELCDWIFPQYREVGVMFWRGYGVKEYLHHMFCNGKDPILGRQMPNHFGLKELNVVTVASPLGTQIPQAAGCAHAMHLQGEKSVALCFFGEGTSSKADFHCGLNFAAVTKAPVIFLCRNNGYAISTPTSEQFASDGVAPRGEGYGIFTRRVDGNDALALAQVVQEAREYCLSGKGPVLIEAMTYRRGAHSTSDDPSRYRPEGEEKVWAKKCPILRLKKYLIKEKVWSESEETELWKTLKEEVDEAIAEAKDEAPPPLRSLIEDVYFSVPESLEEQLAEVSRA